MRRYGRRKRIGTTALAGLLIVGAMAANPALAEVRTYDFNSPSRPLAEALRDYGRISGRQVLFADDLAAGRQAPEVSGRVTADEALQRLLRGTDLEWRTTRSGTILIVRRTANLPQPLAGAPGASNPASSIDELVVTGSHIRGGDAIAQVTDLTRADMERGGFLDLGQALRSLPVNFSGGLNPETSVGNVQQDGAGNNGFHASSANLYGLGSGATLVLLNGRRLPVVGSGVAADLSLVPLAAVERMEVLADGASAVYGADAVAGVVNIITRRRYDGVEARVRRGGAKDGLDTWAGSVITGGEFGPVQGVVGAEQVNQNGLSATARSASADHVQPQTLFGDTKRTSYFGSLTWEISPRLQFNTDAVYLRRSETGVQSSGLTTTNVGGYELSEYAAHAGLKASLWRDWTLDVAATRNGNTGKYHTADISKATGAVTPGAPVRRTNALWSIEANASGSVTELPAGALRVAVGTAYRDESLSSLVARESAGRRVASLYGEAEIPLVAPSMALAGVERFTVSIAGRLDDYSDFGSEAVPKIGLHWKISPELRVRAAASRSFRAPSMYELTSDYFVSILDARDTQSPTGLTRIGYVAGTGRPLGPESAENLNVTVTYEPTRVPGLVLSFGHYHVRYDDRLGAPDPSFAFSSNISAAPASLLVRNPSPSDLDALLAGARGFRVYSPNPNTPIAALIDARSTNVASTLMSGFQGAASYSRSLGGGTLDLSWDGNYLAQFREQLLPNAQPVSRVDRIYSPADWRMRSGVSWSDSRWSGALYWNYVDNYVDNRQGPSKDVASYSTIDATLTYAFGERSAPGLRGARVIASATNLFDRGPPATAPAAITNYRWDPTNASIVGRFLSLELVKSW